MPTLWAELHEFLRSTPAEVHLNECNDDLVGFFNAVPREAILHALSALTRDYQAVCPAPALTVNLRPQQGQAKAFAGKPRGGKNTQTKALWIEDLPAIVQLSFDTGVFLATGVVFRQIRGTCIDNQLSPVLSSLPVLQRERMWRSSWQSQLADGILHERHHENTFICRYVDNRLILSTDEALRSPLLYEFVQLNFYGKFAGDSIQLEEVTDHRFLGFHLNAAERTLEFAQPDRQWQIRHVHSAGSWTTRLAGFYSRKALISKYAWPPSQRKVQIEALRRLYREAGYPANLLV